MTNRREFHVAIVGVTGAVGGTILKTLEERNFPIASLRLLASARSAGQEMTFRGQSIVVEEATAESFKNIDIAFFSAGGSVSKKLAHKAAESGAVVIDNTSAFRMEPNVPLVVPEVNPEDILTHQGIIANPNCSTIQMVVVLKPLADRYGLKRVIVSTYQAVSGAGHQAMEELKRQTRAYLNNEPVNPDILPVAALPKKHQMAFNAIPQIDRFDDNGYTLEEMKMVNETKKIMHDQSLEVAATCVRLPVLNGHSESVYVELKSEPNLDELRQVLADAPGIMVEDNPMEQVYPLATQADGRPEVFVGRIRRDLDRPNGVHLWIVADNLAKGAALNSIQIAEEWIARTT